MKGTSRRGISLFVAAVAVALVCEAALVHRGAVHRPLASGDGSVPTFAGDAQHAAVFLPVAQDLNAIHWSTRPAGVDAAGEAGIVASAFSASADSSVANFTIRQ